MRSFGPRALTPRDGLDWLVVAWQLMRRRPGLFITVALLAPSGSATLLYLPIWGWLFPLGRGWGTLLATVICYGLPLSLTVTLACGVARAANRKQAPPAKQLFNRTALRVVTRTGFLLFILLLQGYLLVYWIHDQILPADLAAIGEMSTSLQSPFGVARTLLGTQLSVLGGIVLVSQVLLAGFIVPLQLFRELPLAECWRRSTLAMQLNPWLVPILGLVGLALLILPFVEWLQVPVQVVALPLPVYLGALLYVAWNDVFQGGMEEEEAYEEIQELWRIEITGGSVSRRLHISFSGHRLMELRQRWRVLVGRSWRFSRRSAQEWRSNGIKPPA